MRLLLSICLAAAVVFAAVGCTKNTEKTVATQVQNPKGIDGLSGQKEPAAPAKAAEAKPVLKPVKGNGKWVKQKSGLKYKDIMVGQGAEAVAGKTVVVNYKGWLDNGTVFDTSKKPGREPFTFTLGNGQVIKGWDQGVAGMKVGGIRELTIPSELGYGSDDQGVIPPNSTLHFTVELLNIP